MTAKTKENASIRFREEAYEGAGLTKPETKIADSAGPKAAIKSIKLVKATLVPPMTGAANQAVHEMKKAKTKNDMAG